ncbi:M56 family metallopeptidase [Streptomyces sp. NBC_01728]|uniref:M56 family metallopeptidase n=1 Tax=unclassified Streptomyces TaxID=2593676 RepID=UPI00224DBB94|nr:MULTISPECIES: M56 family metallopeptidase [unclassified Streptomyces]MCX4458721.1 M56 family metallopeptidase [Streptomyces sp. NBC_01719]MCX4498078.1 M56 family metallopeptidase [Streptomyces sp. NBC_01728]
MKRKGGCPTTFVGDPLWTAQSCDISSVPFWAAFGSTGLVMLATFGLYWWLASWKGRRGGLVSIPNQSSEHQLLGRLADKAEIVHEPHFLVAPGALTAGAVVFGRFGQYAVCLHAGLLARRASDPKMFEAVILHELAHIRNHDVDIAYFTVALWRVFLVTALLPYAAWQVWLLYQGQVLAPLVDMGFCAFVGAQVYLVRTDLLRKRELYADFDAIGWGADPAIWHTQAPAATDSGGGRGAKIRLAVIVWAFAGIWRTHPNWAQRHGSLARPYSPAGEALFGNDSLSSLLVLSETLTLVASWLNFMAEAPQATVPRWVIGVTAYLTAAVALAAIITVSRNLVALSSEHSEGRPYIPVPMPSGTRKDEVNRIILGSIIATGYVMLMDPLHLLHN